MKTFFIALCLTLIFGCGGSDESKLFACAACDKEYSKKAHECPNCGEPNTLYETIRQISDEVQKLKEANEPFMNKDGTLWEYFNPEVRAHEVHVISTNGKKEGFLK